MLRVGIIGMGFGAAVHLPAFSARSDVTLAAVADSGSGRAKQEAARYGGALRPFSSGLSLARWDGIDIVSIAVPPCEQEGLVRAALVAGKHVLCEKPFCLGAEAAKELAVLAHERRLAGAVFYEFRYDPGIRRLIEMIRAGKIGNVQRLAVTWQTSGALDPQRTWSWRHDTAKGGGVLVDWFSHVADYARQIAQSPIRSVWARTATNVAERRDKHGTARLVTAPDECDVICHFANGATGVFSVTTACPTPAGHRIEVVGDEGMIVFHHPPPFSAGGRSVRLVRGDGEETLVDLDLKSSNSSSDQRIAAATELISDFLLVLRGESRPLLPTFSEGAATWRVIEAATSASADGCQREVH
ncbi:MAG: Gfo/Idh/MocA family oxidoreductase [Rhodocyclales bacterium]|nr:Gfo/Idh/MocA family oxidoreductase [Rhodocyclales bacterium]